MTQLLLGLKLFARSKRILWLSSILATTGLGALILGVTWPPIYVKADELVLEAGKLPYTIQGQIAEPQSIAYVFVLIGMILVCSGIFSFFAWQIGKERELERKRVES